MHDLYDRSYWGDLPNRASSLFPKHFTKTQCVSQAPADARSDVHADRCYNILRQAGSDRHHEGIATSCANQTRLRAMGDTRRNGAQMKSREAAELPRDLYAASVAENRAGASRSAANR